MTNFVYIILPLLFLTAPQLEAENRVLHYKPEVVQIEGVIESQTFPGPPNYESIKDGDEVERVWILRLDVPFDAVTTAHDEDVEATLEKNIKFIHLAIFNKAIWPKLAIGKHVRVKGSLYHRENGHHHSRVLLETHGLEEVK